MTNVQIAEAETTARVDGSGCILSIYEPEEELAVLKACVVERKEHFVFRKDSKILERGGV